MNDSQVCIDNIYKEISEIKPWDLPIRPPEVIGYDALGDYERSQARYGTSNKPPFWEQDFAKEYLDKKWEAEVHNRDAFLRLYELFSSPANWPDGNSKDEKAKDLLRAKMSVFKKGIQGNAYAFRALKIDFNKYPFGEETEEKGWDD